MLQGVNWSTDRLPLTPFIFPVYIAELEWLAPGNIIGIAI